MGMGYQGFVKMYTGGPAAGPVVILATGASVNLVLEPIYSTAVWGAGWYNAADSAHYADNAVRFEGSVDFELQGSDDIWDLLGDWIVNERAYPRSMDISPDGGRVYQYRTTGAYDANYDLNGMWNTSAGFSTSEGSFVTVSAGAIALNRAETDPGGGTSFSDYSYILQKTGVVAGDCTTLGATNPLNPSGNNVDPIPYWRTNAQLYRKTYAGPFDVDGAALPQTGLETVEWSVDVTQNQVVLYTANGNRLPTALLQGPMSVSGSVVLYNENTVFDPIFGPDGSGSLTDPYMVAEDTYFLVEIQRAVGATIYMEVPAVVIESDDYGIPGQDAITNRTFSIKGLGGRCNSNTPTVTMPPFLMSDSTGAFVAP
jgi:hypothetical protein